MTLEKEWFILMALTIINIGCTGLNLYVVITNPELPIFNLVVMTFNAFAAGFCLATARDFT